MTDELIGQVILWLILAVIVIFVVYWVMNWLYRRSTAEVLISQHPARPQQPAQFAANFVRGDGTQRQIILLGTSSSTGVPERRSTARRGSFERRICGRSMRQSEVVNSPGE
jgi:hypothetical protein